MCDSAAMRSTLRFGILLLGLGLILVGAGAVVAPASSSTTYGVPTAEYTWVAATGFRDIAFGVLLVLLQINAPHAVRWVLPPLLILPVADVGLVLAAGRPLTSTLPHLAGAVVIAVLCALCWRTRADAIST